MNEPLYRAVKTAGRLAETLENEPGPPVCLAVVDGSGALVYLYRMAGAPARLVAIATAKAYTAVRMGQPTQAFRERLERERLTLADFQDDGLTSLPGGWPLSLAGNLWPAWGSAAVPWPRMSGCAGAGSMA
ncbi:heme-binding protein [Oceanimonas pelagia]|uniref:Heme-binding protein n=1 Tax=Oceanimonas pelagia TaxID=3028314 RepID=A0AA50KNV1_9GAMM|nr:heme-binding protein [Oceanimonas pelagia]WMC11280.1 heme-binding protein [Oceanimonas pelagia]